MKIEQLVNIDLINGLTTASKSDVIIKRILDKEYSNINDLVNSLASGVLCIYYRETSNQMLIQDLLNSNPQVKAILQVKHDTPDIPK